ncbi:hypothetical protein M569_16212 [Genlisea aurea]|uniref:Uncharacterized protein n=1 Tax=Genlisea aurea TaxID=192259 RepID=S8DGT8_9LAMI|nr:hypothetical protein M569_16212 [Genlisea aurea]
MGLWWLRFMAAFDCGRLNLRSISNPASNRTSDDAVLRTGCHIVRRPTTNFHRTKLCCKASASDPMSEILETHKFKAELLKNLSTENDAYGNDLQRVVNICAEADILGVLAGGIGRAGNVINGAVHRYVCGPQRE